LFSVFFILQIQVLSFTLIPIFLDFRFNINFMFFSRCSLFDLLFSSFAYIVASYVSCHFTIFLYKFLQFKDSKMLSNPFLVLLSKLGFYEAWFIVSNSILSSWFDFWIQDLSKECNVTNNPMIPTEFIGIKIWKLIIKNEVLGFAYRTHFLYLASHVMVLSFHSCFH